MADLRTIKRMQRLREESQPLGDQLYGMMGGERGREERLNMSPLNPMGGQVLPALLAEYMTYIQPTTATGRVKDIVETTISPYTNILSGRGGPEDYAFAALTGVPLGKKIYKLGKTFAKNASSKFLKGEKGSADFEFLMRALRQQLDDPKEALKSVPVKHIPTPLKKKKKKGKGRKK